VPSNILPQNQARARLPEGRGMHRAGLSIDRLRGCQCAERQHDLLPRGDAAGWDQFGRAQRFGKGVDATEPASGGPRKESSPVAVGPASRFGEPLPQLDPELVIKNLHTLDFLRCRPSVRLNPRAMSSRSFGVAIITA
jgi:hypothetical protein